MRKRNFLMAAGACLAALTVLAPTAIADPPAGTTRVLAGVGSLTTDDVMQQMSTVITDIANYSSNLPGTINTKADIPGSTCDPLPRDGGSTAGVRALIRERELAAAPNPVRRPCLDFARSSDDSSQRAEFAGDGMTYVPFAVDGVTIATRGNASITTNFPITFLRDLYRCTNRTVNLGFRPLLPMETSGTRSFFLARIGVTEAEALAARAPSVGGNCFNPNGVGDNPGAVSWQDPTNPTQQLPEHICNRLTDQRHLVPHSIAQFNAQQSGSINDDTGTCKMRRMSLTTTSARIIPDLSNPEFPLRRAVFNVIPTQFADNPAGTPYGSVFIGNGSSVCTNTNIIQGINGFGLLTNPDPLLPAGNTGCGDHLRIRTPGGAGPVTGLPTS